MAKWTSAVVSGTEMTGRLACEGLEGFVESALAVEAGIEGDVQDGPVTLKGIVELLLDLFDPVMIQKIRECSSNSGVDNPRQMVRGNPDLLCKDVQR